MFDGWGEFLSAMSGAGFGAFAANRYSIRQAAKEQLSKEIHLANRASLLAFGICNAALSFKEQHIRDLVTHYNVTRSQVIGFMWLIDTGAIPPQQFRYFADLKSLITPELPSKNLFDLVLDGMNISGKVPFMVIHLHQSTDALIRFLLIRNDLINEYRKTYNQQTIPPGIYFGIELQDASKVDSRYSDSLDAIVLHLDCVIYFSKRLCELLTEYTNTLVQSFHKKYGADVPRAFESNFKKAELMGLIPNAADFQSIESAVFSLPQHTWLEKLKINLRKEIHVL